MCSLFQFYKSQLKPLLGDPEKVDKKFKQIIDQRESRNNSVQAKVLFPEGAKWVDIDKYLMEK